MSTHMFSLQKSPIIVTFSLSGCNSTPVSRVSFKPPEDVLSNAFIQHCIHTKGCLARLHDAQPSDIARDLIIAIKHLEVNPVMVRMLYNLILASRPTFMDA